MMMLITIIMSVNDMEMLAQHDTRCLQQTLVLAHTPFWPAMLSLLLLRPPGTLYPLTFDRAKAFSLSNTT